MQQNINVLNDAQFLKEKPSDVVSKIKKMIASGEIKQRDIVRYSEYSSGVISSFLDGSYKGDNAAIEQIIIRFYRKWIIEQMVCENSFVREMKMHLDIVHKKKYLGVITAPFGSGKSVAAAHYATNSQDSAAYVELPSTTTTTSIINRIGETIGASLTGSKDDRLESIKRELTRYSKVLIIDEADNLNPRTLAILKDIYGSKAAQRCGVALVGTENLDTLLQASELGYLRSRININVQLKLIPFFEAKDIADMWSHDLDNEELKNAWLWATQGHGHLRGFANLIELADTIAQGFKLRKIDSDCLLHAYTLIDKKIAAKQKLDEKKK